MNVKLNALLVVVIGGFLDAIAGYLTDNKDFNFHGGMRHLVGAGIVGAIIAVAAWMHGKTVIKNEKQV